MSPARGEARYSRPPLDEDAPQATPRTVPEARNAVVAAGDRWRAEGSEKAGWALDKAALVLIAVTYGAEGIT